MSNAVHGANPAVAAPSATATATSPSATPGSTPTSDLVSLGQRRLLGNYRQPALVLARGQGCELWDTAGKRYLDMYAGVAVASLGHAHPRLTATIAEQAGKLMHTSNYFFNEENVRLAGELCEKTGYDRAFFCNSGAEANEAMLKLGRRYHFARGDAARTRFIAFHQSFHGRTMGAVTLTGNPKYHEGFGPMMGGVTHVAYGDLAAVEKEMGPDVAAVFVETVQGEGGVMPSPPGFLAGLRALCDRSGALLLVDEVQTGIARTGKMLGSDHEGVRGDAIALAKGLGGGFPIGALLVRAEVAGALPPGSHGSTFGGNPLASAAARTVLAVIDEEGLLDQVTRRGERLSRGLADIAARRPGLAVGERGRGLLRGLRLAQGVDPRKALDAARERGVLLTVAGADVLRFTPPLIVTEAQIDEALTTVDAALASL
jgi:acetylornithine/N-succinyldiaminopimelate aminotransferase